jgi:hypothetical protein
MKLLFVLSLLIASASAQTSPSPRVTSACGAQETILRVEEDASSPIALTPDSAKATIVFIQDDGISGARQHYTIKIGLNGNWVGAYKQNAYFVVSVDPGEQHVCANVQSKSDFGSIFALAHFKAEAGHVYYFRTRFLAGLNSQYPPPPVLAMDTPDSDEAKFLVASYPLAHMVPAR